LHRRQMPDLRPKRFNERCDDRGHSGERSGGWGQVAARTLAGPEATEFGIDAGALLRCFGVRLIR
jgi:hypothetical protein